MTEQQCSKQGLLERRVAECIKNSGRTLNVLQRLTGINRAKLGRMRLCRCRISCDEADKVFGAIRRPSRALMTLALLGEDRTLTPEATAYLDNFLANLPGLLDRLDELGPTLNPKWAHGSAHHLGVLMQEHADRRLQAEAFAPGGADRFLN